MSNVSLKEQLQAVASQLSETFSKEQNKKNKAQYPSHLKQVKKPKPQWLEYVQYGFELLIAYFPACFKSSNEVRPLKKGIKQDLLKSLSTMRHIVIEDKACMVKSLSYYANTVNYHKSIVEGAVRIDLEGYTSGIVSAEEAKYAMERCQ